MVQEHMANEPSSPPKSAAKNEETGVPRGTRGIELALSENTDTRTRFGDDGQYPRTIEHSILMLWLTLHAAASPSTS